MKRAAGFLFVAPDGAVLLVRRSAHVASPGVWSTPGGMLEPGETALDAAVRETEEELGTVPRPLRIQGEFNHEYDGLRYTTIVAHVSGWMRQHLRPALNWENDAWGWFHVDVPPRPLHFGVALILQRLS